VPIDKEPYGYDNSYFGSVGLDVQKETDSGTRYRLTLVPKRSTGDVMGEFSIVHEATVSIPLKGDAVRLFAGQIPDWQGYEYLPPTQNKLITHNLLFDFTLPSAYTGAGLEFSLGDVAMKAALVNINTSVRNIGENVPALVFRGDYEVSEFLGFGFAGLVGPKANFRSDDANPVTGDPYDTQDTVAATFEVDGWYDRGDLSLFGHLAYGQQADAAITADPDTGEMRDARWFGVSALVGYKLTPRLQGLLRGDYIVNGDNGGGLLDWTLADPSNGIGPDQLGGDPEKGADRYAITVGANYAISENATFKAEYRYDGATQNVFGNKDALTGGPAPDFGKSNSLLSTGVVVFF
jgi:opacity protein-like surface antigen